jgi:hypothetical protein
VKPTLTLIAKKTITVAAVLLMVTATISYGQVSVVCSNPTNTAYGLTNTGEIYEINTTTAATIRTIKNNVYAGAAPASSNGMGYNTFNGKFYYFKRNITSGSQEFVSFNPTLNVVSALAASTCTADVHTGCVSFSGAGYYTVDIQGTLHYYDIALNKWTFITSLLVDQNGNNVTNIIKTQSAGDMAIDGLNNMWILTSSNTNYGLYKFPANLPTKPVAQVNVVCAINPTAVTPTGNSFAGIAFKPNGQILMTTRGDDKLYLLQTTNTLTFVGNLTTVDVGNDLTSCNFPAGVLPVTWISFGATVQNKNRVELKWEVLEYHAKAYNIEVSTNGKDWIDVASINAKNNPEFFNAYSYSHINSLNGKQYYRIRQVDLDGKTSYTEIVTATVQNDKQNITIFPNPATDEIRLANYNSAGNVFYTNAQIFDLSGKMVKETVLRAGTASININKLPVGAYLIKIQTNNGDVYNQKFIKQ